MDITQNIKTLRYHYSKSVEDKRYINPLSKLEHDKPKYKFEEDDPQLAPALFFDCLCAVSKIKKDSDEEHALLELALYLHKKDQISSFINKQVIGRAKTFVNNLKPYNFRAISHYYFGIIHHLSQNQRHSQFSDFNATQPDITDLKLTVKRIINQLRLKPKDELHALLLSPLFRRAFSLLMIGKDSDSMLHLPDIDTFDHDEKFIFITLVFKIVQADFESDGHDVLTCILKNNIHGKYSDEFLVMTFFELLISNDTENCQAIIDTISDYPKYKIPEHIKWTITHNLLTHGIPLTDDLQVKLSTVPFLWKLMDLPKPHIKDISWDAFPSEGERVIGTYKMTFLEYIRHIQRKFIGKTIHRYFNHIDDPPFKGRKLTHCMPRLMMYFSQNDTLETLNNTNFDNLLVAIKAELISPYDAMFVDNLQGDEKSILLDLLT